MSKANQLDENEKNLLEHVDKFFEGVTTQDELFALLRMCFKELSEVFNGLVDRKVLELEELGRYQWAATVIPAIVRTLELGPKYDTPKLEEQLKGNFRALLKGGTRRTFTPD